GSSEMVWRIDAWEQDSRRIRREQRKQHVRGERSHQVDHQELVDAKAPVTEVEGRHRERPNAVHQEIGELEEPWQNRPEGFDPVLKPVIKQVSMVPLQP